MFLDSTVISFPGKSFNGWIGFALYSKIPFERHEKNSALLSMKYWLFNRDPYHGLLDFIRIPV